MSEFVNQTTLGVDKKYLPRFKLPDIYTFWDSAAPEYNPATPVHPDCDFVAVQERLAQAGLEIASVQDLTEMAKMDTDDAAYNFGEAVRRIRHPLGRTGINGTGVFHKTGPSYTADVVALRDHPDAGPQVALVHVRGKWAIPGGFMEDADEGDAVVAGIRELWEETNLDVRDWHLGIDDPLEMLIEDEVKPQSRKSADLGWLINNVTGVMLPDWKQGETLAIGTEDPSEEIDAVGWFNCYELDTVIASNIGQDHRRYVDLGFDRLATQL